VTVIGLDEAPDEVVAALSSSPPVTLLDPSPVSRAVAYLVPMTFVLIFFFASFSFGYPIAQSVTEEKQTRIVEILVATVPVRALLAGKVLANAILAIGQIALIAVVSVIGLRGADMGALLSLLGPAIAWFIPFFIVGFLMLASMWAVAGALVARQEDLAATTTPVSMLIQIPFFSVIFLNDNPFAMKIMSYIPFTAPTAMPLRLFNDDAAMWEPVVALAVLAGTAALFVALGARLYEGSLLRTNGRTSLKTAWRSREQVTAG
jgi:ABC-2 type transport system permease protein